MQSLWGYAESHWFRWRILPPTQAPSLGVFGQVVPDQSKPQTNHEDIQMSTIYALRSPSRYEVRPEPVFPCWLWDGQWREWYQAQDDLDSTDTDTHWSPDTAEPMQSPEEMPACEPDKTAPSFEENPVDCELRIGANFPAYPSHVRDHFARCLNLYRIQHAAPPPAAAWMQEEARALLREINPQIAAMENDPEWHPSMFGDRFNAILSALLRAEAKGFERGRNSATTPWLDRFTDQPNSGTTSSDGAGAQQQGVNLP